MGMTREHPIALFLRKCACSMYVLVDIVLVVLCIVIIIKNDFFQLGLFPTFSDYACRNRSHFEYLSEIKNHNDIVTMTWHSRSSN